MNFAVEMNYCHGPMDPNDGRFLMKETWDFCSKHNKLFLSRPDWMVHATCASAYLFSFGYVCVLVATVTNAWRRLSLPILLFIGAKIYAILFYHYMELTHPTLAPAPESMLPYLSVELPYLISMVLVISKVAVALSTDPLTKAKVQ
jgi:hypothetical protein